MAVFINFKELRAQLDFRTVLESYGVTVRTGKGSQHHGRCPLPTHLGVQTKPCFSVDVARGIWRCFSCQSSGNLLDFAVRMEGLDPENGADVRRVALQLRKQLVSPAPKSPGSERLSASVDGDERVVVVNAPLPFALKQLDHDHPSIGALGVSPASVAHFGLGYCTRGSLQGRIAIPLHDLAGQLVGYAGRLVGVPADVASEPLYRLPGDRMQKGITYHFDASALLYGAHAVTDTPVRKLIVAEELSLVWHLFELGVQAVALLTPHLTAQQETLLQRLADPGGIVFVGRSTTKLATSV